MPSDGAEKSDEHEFITTLNVKMLLIYNLHRLKLFPLETYCC